ncbi:hypothetical protein OHC33_005687 [Knufia fluminis]|uniref:Uncharacterized protein n=1 Tax=Knufia fluminis TaxID=191047 RepID=A0AAN8I5K4_9EURO|nr:hypothetical protein OHC33_005687 [Knufia fluminis]
MVMNPFSPHGAKGPIRSNARLIGVLTLGGGLLFWLRVRGQQNRQPRLEKVELEGGQGTIVKRGGS